MVIVGPTAVGKSALALRLARQLDAGILAADSRQVYRYMDIGTAKPTSEERTAVRHYMIDLVAPDEAYSAQRYRSEGLAVLRRIAAEGRVALVVGGTGFYIRALLDGLILPDVPPNPRLRARLRDEAEELGPVALHERLRELDPDSADRIHAHNLPRVIRALEIVEGLGGPVPVPVPAETLPALYIGLSLERSRLWKVADRRVVAQVEAGLPEETRLLLEMGYSADLPPIQGFGYSQMVAHLAGALSLDQAVRSYQTATHQYIRRQMTWFGTDERIHWLNAAENPLAPARRLIDNWLDPNCPK